MNSQLLKKLSDADSIASCEDEVREILYQELKEVCDDISCDALGSLIFHKRGTDENALKIMICAHMDEVGFIVRHISDIGFLYVMAVGGVLDKSKEMQIVRVTTEDGQKIEGLLNVTKDDEGHIKEMYIDIGCDTREEVEALGIEVGNMVCFASQMRSLSSQHVYMGKAMDDRSGCYVFAETLKHLSHDTKNDLYFVATSSEEVGLRGAQTATYQIDPDVDFAVDVANNPELVKNYTNHRLIGKGPMLVHYDKTMAPNRQLIRYVKAVANKHQIPYQNDMLSGGGTDAGQAHLQKGGRLAMVLGIPLRYCHGAYSMVHADDLDHLVELLVHLLQSDAKEYRNMTDYLGGK